MISTYPLHRCGDMERGITTVHQRLHILIGAARHHKPLRAIIQRQQAMVLEKLDKEPGGKHLHLLQGTGPDSTAHGQNIIPGKALTVTVLAQIFPQRNVSLCAIEQGRRLLVESQDVTNKAPV